MKKFRKYLFNAVVIIVVAALTAAITHRCDRKPIETKVVRDTVTVVDTVAQFFPKPVEVERTRTEYRWLTRVVTENVEGEKNSANSASFSAKDSALVEVPITSKHYQSRDYDAWVSGYEPSLDSIKVYQRTQMITEIRTISKPPNKWELDLIGGINYNINNKKYTPHVGGELMYKPNRLQVGVRGGIQYDNTVQPFVGGVVKYRLF